MHRSLEFFHQQLTIRIDQRMLAGGLLRPGTMSGPAALVPSGQRSEVRVWHTRVALRGVLDIATCQWARTVFDHVLDQTGDETVGVSAGPGSVGEHLMFGPPWWVLNTRQVKFLSAGGLTVLEDVALRCRRGGGGLTLVGQSRAVERVLSFSDPLGAWSELSAERGIVA
ncbi:MAG TPA: STAS domain-containing protein [Pseudonocardia sp.]|nr:STAS domain-containing protein [Pseudonocardia sp.]